MPPPERTATCHHHRARRPMVVLDYRGRVRRGGSATARSHAKNGPCRTTRRHLRVAENWCIGVRPVARHNPAAIVPPSLGIFPPAHFVEALFCMWTRPKRSELFPEWLCFPDKSKNSQAHRFARASRATGAGAMEAIGHVPSPALVAASKQAANQWHAGFTFESGHRPRHGAAAKRDH